MKTDANHPLLREQALQATAHFPGGLSMPLTPRAVSADGVEVEVTDWLSWLAVGAELTLELRCDRLGAALATPARLEAIEPGAGALRLRLAFTEGVPFDAAWPAPFRALFNRRAAYRVQLPDREQPSVTLDGAWLHARGRLVDISCLGAGVVIPADEEPPGRVMLNISHPDIAVQLQAEVCRVVRQGDQLLLGLRFSQSGGARARRSRAMVERFVVRAQRAELRSARYRRAACHVQAPDRRGQPHPGPLPAAGHSGGGPRRGGGEGRPRGLRRPRARRLRSPPDRHSRAIWARGARCA